MKSFWIRRRAWKQPKEKRSPKEQRKTENFLLYEHKTWAFSNHYTVPSYSFFRNKIQSNEIPLFDVGIYIVQFALCIIYLFVFHWFDTSFTMNYLKIIISSTPILIYLARQWPQHNFIEPCSINRQQFGIVDTHFYVGACGVYRRREIIQYMFVYHTPTPLSDSNRFDTKKC